MLLYRACTYSLYIIHQMHFVIQHTLHTWTHTRSYLSVNTKRLYLGKEIDVFMQEIVRPKISLILFHLITAWYTQNPSQIATFQQQSKSNWQKRGNKIQCVQKVAVHLQKLLEVMSTCVYTGLNPVNFIRKHFLQICCEMFLMNAVNAVFNSLSVRGGSPYTAKYRNLRVQLSERTVYVKQTTKIKFRW
jgi:hypothetical protein